MKNYFGKEMLLLDKSRYSVVQAEAKTGIVLTTNGNRHFKDSDETYILIFDSIDEAKKFSKNKIAENPEIECNIYDHSATFIELISK